MVLPPSLQSSLPAGWLAFTGRELNPLDRYKRFQITSLLPLFWIHPGAREASSQSACRAVQSTSLLFRLHGRRLDDRRPALDLVFDQRGEGLLTAPGRVRNF